MKRSTQFEVLSWDFTYQLLIELAEKIRKSNYRPDLILGISRGGWPPARVISDFLENPNIANIKVEFYTDISKMSKEPIITQTISTPVEGKSILLVDDVADTGKTLKLVYNKLIENNAKDIKVATLYYKPKSIFKPDFFMINTKAWVVFPWERYETIKSLGSEMIKEGKHLDEVEVELVKIGLEPLIVKRFLNDIFGEKKC
ncbi:phosphoribosyltransferase [Candidatus Bathyarchaeota archaeon]|nr:phosphoribosyltransferase [Candidatus Bathyarchaeota archaeon]